MRAGLLRHEITIQQPSRAANSDGQLIDSWSTYITRRANVVPVAGGEAVQPAGRRLEAETTHTITLRSDAETRLITTKMRVQFEGRTLHIRRAYDVDHRRTEFMVECEERA